MNTHSIASGSRGDSANASEYPDAACRYRSENFFVFFARLSGSVSVRAYRPFMASSLLPPTKKPTAGSFTRMYRVGPRRPPPPPPLKGAIAPGPTNPLDASDEPIAHHKSSATRRRARRTRMVAPPRRDARRVARRIDDARVRRDREWTGGVGARRRVRAAQKTHLVFVAVCVRVSGLGAGRSSHSGACRLIRMPNNVHSNNRISTGRKNQPTDIGRSRRVVIREKKRGLFATWMARVGNERLWLAFKTRTICGRAMKRRPLAFRTARARGDARP